MSLALNTRPTRYVYERLSTTCPVTFEDSQFRPDYSYPVSETVFGELLWAAHRTQLRHASRFDDPGCWQLSLNLISLEQECRPNALDPGLFPL